MCQRFSGWMKIACLFASAAVVSAAHPAGGTGSSTQKLVQIQLGGVDVAFVRVPGGEFVMGSDRPEPLRRQWDDDQYPGVEMRALRVRVTGFLMSRTLVTRGQYRPYCVATGANEWFPGTATAEHPANFVTYEHARGYAVWATGELRRQGLKGVIRLPWEVEWEYAARGIHSGVGGQPRWMYVDGPEGGEPDPGSRAATGAQGEATEARQGDGLSSVLSSSPNSFGLFNLMGNVYEYCADAWSTKYQMRGSPPYLDPRVPVRSRNSLVVCRGGGRPSPVEDFLWPIGFLRSSAVTQES